MDMLSGTLPPMMHMDKPVEPLPSPTIHSGRRMQAARAGKKLSSDESSQEPIINIKKKHPPKKNYHIKTLDNKLVCCVPPIPEHFKKSSLPDAQGPLLTPITTVNNTYVPFVEHPNLATTPPTRYSANKNMRKPATGIVPMPVMWMEMTEQMKTGGSKYRRKSRKSRGLTVGTAKGSQPKTEGYVTHSTASVHPPKSMVAKRKSLPKQLPSIPRESLRKDSRKDSLMLFLPKQNIDRIELFHRPAQRGPKWDSHWVGPI